MVSALNPHINLPPSAYSGCMGKGLGGEAVLRIRWGKYYRNHYHRKHYLRGENGFGSRMRAGGRWEFAQNRVNRVNRKLITLCSLLLCGYFLSGMQVITWPDMMDRLSEGLLKQARRMYLAGFYYMEEDHAGSVEEWLAEQAMRLIPISGYVETEQDLGTDMEDAKTYAMILAKQANDENAVDSDGNLIGTDDSAKTANTAAVIDT